MSRKYGMVVAKAEISDKKIFSKIKDSLDLNSYVECDLCGAIRVEAIEMARVLHSFIANVEKEDEKLNYLCSNILDQLVVIAPDDMEGFVEFIQWKKAEDRSAYYFLGTDDKACGYYDDVIVYCDSACKCFSKDKIMNDLTD